MKILTLDIETAPNLGYFWGTRLQNIPPSFILQDTYMLSWAAKWYGKKKVMYADCRDPKFIQKIFDLVDEADAVVHYNGESFDMKHLNREFLQADLPPPLKPWDVDLLRSVRKRFKYPSNTLEFVARKVLGETKAETGGIQTWFGCMAGDRKAWAKMRKYNIQDVQLTERLYTKIRPWILNHPNHGLWIENQDKPVCRCCGSANVHGKGWQATSVGGYQRYRCTDCGHPQRGRYAIKGGKAARQILA
jgi:DNA polymerase elongation subunit (family B)